LSWIFKNFVSDRGENEIRRWLSTLPKKVVFKIDTRIKYLQEVDQLKFPYVEKWSGVSGLFEVRVVFSGVQYRILGCYGQGKDFLLLIGAVEKDWQLEPRNAENIAKARMKLISNRSNFCDHFRKEEN